MRLTIRSIFGEYSSAVNDFVSSLSQGIVEMDVYHQLAILKLSMDEVMVVGGYGDLRGLHKRLADTACRIFLEDYNYLHGTDYRLVIKEKDYEIAKD